MQQNDVIKRSPGRKRKIAVMPKLFTHVILAVFWGGVRVHAACQLLLNLKKKKKKSMSASRAKVMCEQT